MTVYVGSHVLPQLASRREDTVIGSAVSLKNVTQDAATSHDAFQQAQEI